MNLQHQRIEKLCRNLNLVQTAESYLDIAQSCGKEDSSYTDFLESVLKTELTARQNRSKSILTRMAGFPAIKTLDEFDYNFATGVKRQILKGLRSLSFMERYENIIFLGPSGVGKSVLIQEMATTMLSHNVRMFILDIGKSYENICKLLGGEFIRFGSASRISLNPLSGLVDESGKLKEAILEDGSSVPIKTIRSGEKEYYVSLDGVMYAKNIITSMCGAGNNPHKEALIEDAIYRGVEQYGSDLTISKIAEVLKNGNGIEKELGETLLPFTDRGMHGKYFENAANITFKERITVFELEEVAKDETLLSVLMQVVAIQIFMQVLCGDRSQKFMLVVDEAWRALDHSEKFLAEMSRTIRKYGGSLVTCVQNVSDLSTSDHRRTIAQNSEWTVMLEQNSKGLKALEGSAYESLIPLIETIQFVKGSHSEMMLYSSRVLVIGKLLLDPYAQALYSTDDNDFRYLRELESRGIGLDKALEELVRYKSQS